MSSLGIHLSNAHYCHYYRRHGATLGPQRGQRGQTRQERGGKGAGESLYYCGIQARISQFVLAEANRNRKAVQSFR